MSSRTGCRICRANMTDLQLPWRCRIPGGSAELLEQLNEHCALGLREPTRRQIHRSFVTGEYLGCLLCSPRRQPNDAGPPTALVALARHQASGPESIHRSGDRAAGERDAAADLIDRLWSLVKKQL